MKKKTWERLVPLSKADNRSFDIRFWQAQGYTKRFYTAFNMLKEFYKIKGKRIDACTFRLQRAVEALKQA
ncbi:MAG: hypothetical protein NC912_05095 [Candidatus Omnitrophica bacterium]|nr:hypothetical protein [Candidatus Omnitrophota bacterium]